MSPMAVRRIHSGMAGSDRGQISRFSVMLSLSVRARSDNPAARRIASSPNCGHI